MPTKLALKIELPDGVVQRYDDQNEHGRPVEELMAKRLANCVDHNAVRGLYFNDEQRIVLEGLTGAMLPTPADALLKIRQMVTVKVNGVDIQLDQQILAEKQRQHQQAVNAATNFALGMAAAAAGGASSGHSSECCPTSDIDQQSAIQESELDDQRRKINSLQNELDDITNRHLGL
jgi:hypothetical protein